MSESKQVSNPAGRPKGSRNQITIIKLAIELETRSENVDQIKRILKNILDDAEAGDKDMRKLVWSSVMSKAGAEQQQATGDTPQIVLRVEGSPKIKEIAVIEGSAEEIKDGQAV